MILIDSNIYISYLNKRDQNHKLIHTIIGSVLKGEHGNRFSISEVFSETSTIIYRQTKSKEIVKSSWDLFYNKNKAWGKTFLINKELINSALEIFKNHVDPKRKLSFVDCLLIATAKKFNIHKILSFDSEFDGILERVFS